MTNKSIKNIRYPLILISISLCISGLRWLISSEPWMLDQIANEERLQMTFIDLFLIDGNYSLSAYLTQFIDFWDYMYLVLVLLFCLFYPINF